MCIHYDVCNIIVKIVVLLHTKNSNSAKILSQILF